MDRKGIALTLARLSEQDPVFPSSQARETVEILEWVARRGRRADGKERVRRIPAAGWNERATQPAPKAFRDCSLGSRACGTMDIGTALRALANPADAGRPIPVFQQSPRQGRRVKARKEALYK